MSFSGHQIFGPRFGACPETLNWTKKIANHFFSSYLSPESPKSPKKLL